MSFKKKIFVISAFFIFVAIIFLLWKYISQTVGLLIASGIEAYLFLPFVKFFERKLNRTISILICFFIFLFVNGGMLYFLAPVFIKQAQHFINVLPQLNNAFYRKISLLCEKYPQIKENIDDFNFQTNIINSVNNGLNNFSPAKIINIFSTSLLIPVVMFYFIRDREKIGGFLMYLVPVKIKKITLSMFRDINSQLRDYIIGQFFIIIAVSGIMAAALGVFKFEYWLILGIIMGIFNIIPYIGPILGSIPILLVAAENGLKNIAIAIALIVFVQQIDNLIIHPHIISSTVKIHPVIVLICVLLGNNFGSLIGMILAIPIYIVLRIMLKEVFKAFFEKNRFFVENI